MMLIRSLLAACSLCTLLSAQVFPLPGTGCANGAPPIVAGTPQIGQTITIVADAAPCAPAGAITSQAFVALSLTCDLLPPVPFSCDPAFNPCVLIDPIFISSSPGTHAVTLTIPNNPMLIGMRFCAQGGCIAAFVPSPSVVPACYQRLNIAAGIRIMM